MDRANFPEGVEVHQTALDRVESTKAFHIQRRGSLTSRGGRASGLAISIGTPAYRFNLTGGYGFTPRNDYVDYNGTSGISLIDYDSGVENYICLCYRETSSRAEPHESSGTTQNTIVSRSSELKVFTREEYEALTASEGVDFEDNLESSDLTLDAQDRIIVLAVVKGKGYTGSTPNTYSSPDFDNGNIVQDGLFADILTASLESDPSITGVNIRALSSDTNLGAGILQLTGSAGSYNLAWYSPEADGTAPATSPTPTGTGTFNNADDPQVFEITAENSSSVLTVEVFTALLPQSGYPLEVDVTVESLYDEVTGPFSAEDDALRSKKGTYIQTDLNPHGVGHRDMAESVTYLPKPIVAGNDMLDTLAKSILARVTTPRSGEASVDRTLIWQSPGGTGGTIRIYARKAIGYELSINARWTTSSTWTVDTGTVSYLWRYDGGMKGLHHTGGGSWSDSAWTDAILPITGSTRLGDDYIADNSLNLIPRIEAPRSDGSFGFIRSHMFRSTDNGSGIPLSIYCAEQSSDGGDPAMEFVVNADWDGYNLWNREVNGKTALKVSFSPTGILCLMNNSDSSWGDSIDIGTDWTQIFRIDEDGTNSVVGSFEATETIEAGANLSGSITTPRFLSNGPTSRHLVFATSTGGVNRRVYMNASSGQVDETIGCYWNGTQWTGDSTSASLVRRHGDYIQLFSKADASSPWLDADWDQTNGSATRIATNGAFSRMRDGGIQFTGASSFTNPTAGSSGYRNSIFALNTCKAWGVIQGNGPTLIEGFNFSVTNGGAGSNAGFAVTFIDPITNPCLFVSMSHDIPASDIWSGGHGSENLTDGEAEVFFRKLWYENLSSTGFTAYVARPDGDSLDGGATWNLLASNAAETTGLLINFFVFGRQS